jgi:hypothetical protein
MSDDKRHKTPPEHVGESDLRRGEEIQEHDGKEAGRYDTAKKGKTKRSTGRSTPRDQTGISPSRHDAPEE